METFISEEEILTRIKQYRASLSYDEQFDRESETKILNLSPNTLIKLQTKLTASERRKIRYGKKYEELRKKSA